MDESLVLAAATLPATLILTFLIIAIIERRRR